MTHDLFEFIFRGGTRSHSQVPYVHEKGSSVKWTFQLLYVPLDQFLSVALVRINAQHITANIILRLPIFIGCFSSLLK